MNDQIITVAFFCCWAVIIGALIGFFYSAININALVLIVIASLTVAHVIFGIIMTRQQDREITVITADRDK